MMSELTIDEKVASAVHRARLEELEKHHFDVAQPFFPLGFGIHYRNPGHWDISARQCPGKVTAFLAQGEGCRTTERDGGSERAFRIRGEPGRVVVYDERWDPHRPFPREDIQFRSVMAAMVWICEELMQEPKR